ncbi:MAG: type II secretion system protein [Blastocatellia bacterium]|nr:type II secretion system protein [Blastocatellia bacterium]
MSRRSRLPRRPDSAFTLIELMVVIAIIVILMVLLVPAFRSIKGARDVTSGAYTIKEALDQARAYAMANHTYTWVGFYEEAATNSTSGTSHPAGVGRLVISAVASVDGARYRDAAIDLTNPPAFDNSVSPRPLNNPVVLAQLGKLIRVENVHLATTQIGSARPAVTNSFLVGHDDFTKHPQAAPPYTAVTNPTTFTYPLTGTAEYTFGKAIEFSPKGGARKIVDSVTPLMEITVQPTHSTVIDNADPNIFAIQVGGIGGNIQIYRR